MNQYLPTTIFIALRMSASTESATAASESAPLQNGEYLDDTKESTLDKGEALQYGLDNPPP